MKAKEYELVAAIDVGSNYIRMIISQVTCDGVIEVLEDLIKSSNIGKDAFSQGRISIETIQDTCQSLKGFSALIKEYGIKKYKAVATSGIREAENREYIIDQIRIKTGILVDIINNAEERFFMNKALRKQMKNSELSKKEESIIVNITSGGVEVSINNEAGNLRFTEYIKVGSLRLREMLSDLEPMTIDFPSVMEEFIESKLYLLKASIKNMNIKKFIGLGGELNTILNICNKSTHNNTASISKKDLEELYVKLHDIQSSEQISEKYGVVLKQAEILLPSVILFNCILNMTKADEIYTPMVSLRHGVLYDIVDNMFNLEGRIEALNDITSSVWYIAEKYGVDKKHARFIEKISLAIFDQTWKLHRLGEKERFYLQIAAILHDTGNYVNFSEHNLHSYSIIKTQNILGFSDHELNLTANIAKYHADEVPSHEDYSYSRLNLEEKIAVSKLAAILRLAEALDISHSQKIRELKISNLGDKLIFKIQSVKDTLLEQWDFMNNAYFFEEVMGIKPVIKR